MTTQSKTQTQTQTQTHLQIEKKRQTPLQRLSLQTLPFAQLIRLSKPVGVVIINFPYLNGLYYASSVSGVSDVSLNELFKATVLLTFGTFYLRSWACAWNDIADRNFDKLVARCRNRPMARGAVSPIAGRLFTFCLAVTWYIIMCSFCPFFFSTYGPPLLLLSGIYPYTKRFTHHTPVFLGFTFAWGVLIGSAFGGMDPVLALTQSLKTSGMSLLLLFFHSVIWTTIFETVYAFQDLHDDTKAGIGSMAVRYRTVIRPLLAGLAMLQVGLLITVGLLSSAGFLYYALCPLGNAVILAWMVGVVDFSNTKECGWWFANAPLIVGVSTCVGLLGIHAF
ncbi:Para-hydroxybenzoate--polyprenyltransferase, mitochondrial precursor (PHB:polyprenyltransferase) [Varicellaria rhodocarpa]|nr:Para-hydroxybenzoate--polyprenyltransferase, mitochondrial precursor (PHB:polyprenyltransferase) [Varicellaria rhodocarpa]